MPRTSIILVAFLLLTACVEKKKPPAADKKPGTPAGEASASSADDAGAPDAAGDSARAAADPSGDATGDAAPGTAAEATAAGGGGDGGTAKGPTLPPVPKTKTLVVTMGLGTKDVDVFIGAQKQGRRISYTPTPGELAGIAASAKAEPDAVDDAVFIAVGNSVPQTAVTPLVEAFKAAGFKNVKVSLPRRP